MPDGEYWGGWGIERFGLFVTEGLLKIGHAAEVRVPVPDRLQWHGPTLFGWFQCSLMAYVLGGLFHVQVLTSFWFGWFFLGSSIPFALEPHIKVEGYPWTISELFLGISIAAGIIFMVAAILLTEEARMKWRLRLMVMLFAVFPVGFAYIQYSSKDLNIESAKWQLERLEERRGADSHREGWLDQRIHDLRSKLEEVDR